jgi:hypothetical protein
MKMVKMNLDSESESFQHEEGWHPKNKSYHESSH